MIYERSIYLFVWAISAGLISSEIKPAEIASNQISNHGLFRETSLVKTVEAKQSSQYVSRIFVNSNLVVQQPDPQEAKAQNGMINRRWTGLGIGITSVFFCLLLWILFQPNAQIKAMSTLANTNDDKQDSETNIINNHQVELEEEVSLPPLFSLKEDNLSPASTEELMIVQHAHLIREKQHNPNLTINEDIQHLNKKCESAQIDAENQGVVSITTSNTTNIDVVFELIQDLKKSDRQLRRKAIWELARIGDSRSIEPLINIIPVVNSLDKSLIFSAITQIAYRGFEPIYDVLFTSLEDTNSEVRKDVIRDITALHESTAKITRRLSVMLNDSDEEVRQTAEWALNKINLGSLSQPGQYTINKAVSSKNRSKHN